MNTRKILCPTDFSQFTDAALSYASTLAAESGAKLYIVHVNEPLSNIAVLCEPGIVDPMLCITASRRGAHCQLDAVRPTMPSVDFERHYLEGNPVREIVEFAEREHVDLIVVGSHGRTGLVRLVMGSVAEGIARSATCPVLIVKQPSSEVSGVLQAEPAVTVPSTQTLAAPGASSAG